MSNIISESDSGSSSENNLEPSAKKIKMNKTPISLLTELCTQKVSKNCQF